MQTEQILKLIQRDDSVDAPADTLKWVKNIYRTRMPAAKPSLVQRIFASLQIDLAPGKAAFGERSASTLKSRQLLYSAGDAAIDLRVSDFAGRLDIKGQILGGSYEYSAVRLAGADHVIDSTTDDMSEFEFKSVPAGTYTLSIRSADKEIFIEGIELK